MKRRMGLFLMFGAVLPLVVASAAWACGVLATLSLDTKVASTDQAVKFSGKNYSTSASASPVTLRLSTRAGKTLATANPIAGGNIEGTFSTKGMDPGWYVVSATQSVTTADGKVVPKAGTPGRTTLRIGGASAAASKQSAAVSPWSSSMPTGPAASAASVARDDGPASLPMLLAMALSVTLLVAGATLVGRRRNQTSRLPLGV